MKKIGYRKVVLGLMTLWIALSSFHISEKGTENKGQPLLKITRSRDANEIWYTLNLNQNSSLNTENPIRAFWVKKAENYKTEPLSRIQSRFAYGVKVLASKQNKTNEWDFQFVSYARQTFTLRQISSDIFKVFTYYRNKEMEVTRIFVQIDGGSFWVPSVPYVMLTGIDTQTGREISETIIP
jgi:hypothetical protein